jgi:toxin ParE1/3/4
MKVIWTPRGASDLEDAASFIARDKPDAALRVATTIYRRLMALSSNPEIGRPGLVSGTREVIFHPWPYIAVYRLATENIKIIRIRHAAQRYP